MKREDYEEFSGHKMSAEEAGSVGLIKDYSIDAECDCCAVYKKCISVDGLYLCESCVTSFEVGWESVKRNEEIPQMKGTKEALDKLTIREEL